MGILPSVLVEMLQRFNGAELFIYGLPLVTIFGLSPTPPVEKLYWSPDWYIDTYTKIWRESQEGREGWAFAMTNYGGLMVSNQDGELKEWDTNLNRWISETSSIGDWFRGVLTEGQSYMKE
jgi:hypothetical protein